MDQPKVAIIILNWNGADDTLALLESLSHVTYPNFSVTVVDNASKDDSLGRLARFMEQRRRGERNSDYKLSLLPLSKNFGYAEGNNKGIVQASREHPDYYLLLNNDTVVSPDFLDILVAATESDPKLAAVGPTIYFADPDGTTTKDVWYAGGWLNFYAGGAHHNTEKPAVKDKMTVVPTEFITGCCLLIKRSAITKLEQLFDPLFFAYTEDTDLCLRLLRQGHRLGYVPAASIWHKLARSSGGPKSYNFWYYNVRNNFLVMSRYAAWYHWPVYLLYFLFYKPVLWSVVGAVVKPRRDKWFRLIAIAHGTIDTIRRRYKQRAD